MSGDGSPISMCSILVWVSGGGIVHVRAGV